MNNEEYNEAQYLFKLADRAAVVVLGTMNKDKAAGQSIKPYLAAIREGTQFLRDTHVILKGEPLDHDKAGRLFELSFEKVCLTFGDPYDPMWMKGSMMPLMLDEEDLDDQDFL